MAEVFKKIKMSELIVDTNLEEQDKILVLTPRLDNRTTTIEAIKEYVLKDHPEQYYIKSEVDNLLINAKEELTINNEQLYYSKDEVDAQINQAENTLLEEQRSNYYNKITMDNKTTSHKSESVAIPLGNILEGEVLKGLTAIEILNKMLYSIPVEGIEVYSAKVKSQQLVRGGVSNYTYTIKHNLNTNILGCFAYGQDGESLLIGGTKVDKNSFKIISEQQTDLTVYLLYGATTTAPVTYREYGVRHDYLEAEGFYNWCLIHNLNADIIGAYGENNGNEAKLIPCQILSKNTIEITNDTQGYLNVNLLYKSHDIETYIKYQRGTNIRLEADSPELFTHNIGKKVIGITVFDEQGNLLTLDYDIVDENTLSLTSTKSQEIELIIFYEK